MVQATLTITIPDGVWIRTLSRRFADATFHVRSARSDGGVGVALVEIRGPSVTSILDALENKRPIVEVEVFDQEAGRALLQIEATNPFLLFPIEASATPLQMPFEIRDGTVTWEFITTQRRLSTLSDQLDAFGIPYEVDRVQPEIRFERLLTEKQAIIVEAALDRGYYDSPRTCTLTELANQLNMAASTCSETLHRAEERIIKQFDSDGSTSLPEVEACF